MRLSVLPHGALKPVLLRPASRFGGDSTPKEPNPTLESTLNPLRHGFAQIAVLFHRFPDLATQLIPEAIYPHWILPRQAAKLLKRIQHWEAKPPSPLQKRCLDMLYRVQRRLTQHNLTCLPTEKAQPPWPPNTMVGTCTTQNGDSYGSMLIATLLPQLQKTASVPQALRKLASTVLIVNDQAQGGIMLPLFSPHQASGWQKSDRSTVRRLLVVAGDGDSHPDLLLEATSGYRLRQCLMETYGVQRQHTRMLVRPNKKELEDAFQEMQQFAQERPQAEAMVVLLGHCGKSEDEYQRLVEPGLTRKERSQQGAQKSYFLLRWEEEALEKEDLKALFHHYLADYQSVVLLVSGCYSGGFLA